MTTPIDGREQRVECVESAVAESFRGEWGRVVAAVIATTGEWDLAEDCAQEAFAQALTSWSRDGIPDRPGAWLTLALSVAVTN